MNWDMLIGFGCGCCFMIAAIGAWLTWKDGR